VYGRVNGVTVVGVRGHLVAVEAHVGRGLPSLTITGLPGAGVQDARDRIRPAVESGVLKSGVMYECVKNGVEFVLAGSIRDDGPLPETMMDLVEAQELYAAALSRNVHLVLMLSSMLHSIGVGNMLPSWVRVVCVDINPAVVTKLSDRGSQQTVGVVTDVGLFLHRLAEALQA